MCIYGVVSRVNGPPPWYGGVGTRIRYTHCISTVCRLSTLPQYYKPPPHHRGGKPIHYHNTTNHPHTKGGGNPLLPPPMGGEGGGPANTAPYIHVFVTKYYDPLLATKQLRSTADLFRSLTLRKPALKPPGTLRMTAALWR